MRISDWSSDVCSSDLPLGRRLVVAVPADAVDAFDAGHAGLRTHRLVALLQILADPVRGLGEVAAVGVGVDHGAVAAPAAEQLVERQVAGLGLDVPRSEEHTSELQSLMRISYAVFCLKKKKTYK